MAGIGSALVLALGPTLAPGSGAAGQATTPAPAAAVDPPSEVVAALSRLTGPAWLGAGEGFSSLLTYEWAVPGRVLATENILFDADGNPFRHYRGAYAWDPREGGLTLWVEGPGSERHAGTVRVGEDGLWHRATTGTGGYRSLVTLVSDTIMEYRAAYTGPDAPEDSVRSSSPLVYRRLPAAGVRTWAGDERSYMAGGGGVWWTPNAHADGRPETPARFRYRATEEGEALRVDIDVEMPDGRIWTAWRIVSAWESDPGVVRMHQVGRSGAVLRGRMDPLPDGSALLRMDGTGVEGERITFMDRNVREGPDTFSSRSWLLRDGAWEESRRSTWRRVDPAERRGGTRP